MARGGSKRDRSQSSPPPQDAESPRKKNSYEDDGGGEDKDTKDGILGEERGAWREEEVCSMMIYLNVCSESEYDVSHVQIVRGASCRDS